MMIFLLIGFILKMFAPSGHGASNFTPRGWSGSCGTPRGFAPLVAPGLPLIKFIHFRKENCICSWWLSYIVDIQWRECLKSNEPAMSSIFISFSMSWINSWSSFSSTNHALYHERKHTNASKVSGLRLIREIPNTSFPKVKPLSVGFNTQDIIFDLFAEVVVSREC
jgi:hypothetical protein